MDRPSSPIPLIVALALAAGARPTAADPPPYQPKVGDLVEAHTRCAGPLTWCKGTVEAIADGNYVIRYGSARYDTVSDRAQDRRGRPRARLSRGRRSVRALPLSSAPGYARQVIGLALERRIGEQLDLADLEAAATVAVRGYGPQILGYLRAALGPERADDGFSIFCEGLWKALPGFRREAAFVTWAYQLAWGAVQRVVADPSATPRAARRSGRAAGPRRCRAR